MSRRNRIVLATLAAATAVASSHDAHAAVYSWASAADGIWNVATNWNPSTGSPSSPFDDAAFNLGPSDPAAFAAYTGYTVSLPSAVSMVMPSAGGAVSVGNDKVTLTGHNVNAYNLLVATSAGQNATLNLNSGGGAGGAYGLTVADNGGHATVNVSAGGSLTADYNDYVGYHAGSVGTVNVSAGTTFSAGNLYVGAAGGTGHVTVTGAGSKLQTGVGSGGIRGTVTLGDASSTGTLDITNGGAASVGNDITVADGSSLTLTGSGSKLSYWSGLTISGLVSAAVGTSIERISPANLNPITITPTGTLSLAGEAAVAATSLTNSGTITGSGHFVVNGAFVLNPSSTVALSLTSPSKYDHLGGNINTLTFGGTLSVTAAPSYTPQFGDYFDLIDFLHATPGSAFSSVSLPSLPSPLYWDSSLLYTGGIVYVVPEPTSLLTACGLALPLLTRRRTNP